MVGQVAADETPGTSEESPLLNDEPVSISLPFQRSVIDYSFHLQNELDQSQVSQEKEVTQLAEMLLAQWSNLKVLTFAFFFFRRSLSALRTYIFRKISVFPRRMRRRLKAKVGKQIPSQSEVSDCDCDKLRKSPI